MRTPLGKVRGLGAAKSGTEHFFLQRATAIANIPLVLFFLVMLVALSGGDWQTTAAAFKHPLVAVAMGLAVISVFWHMRLGLQVVIEDYVQKEGAKLLFLLANTFFTLGLGALALFSILKMALA